MGRDEIVSVLQDFKKRYSARYGIQSLGIFGSMARGEEREDSDVDIVVKIDPPNLITLSRIRLEIEEILHKHVDIVHYRERMNKLLKSRIDSEAVYV
ncbi:MAG: nucleotidyltransferase domain-containing protein [Thermoguttaceae bacterium]|jgi:predicted nucleotidyltransferase